MIAGVASAVLLGTAAGLVASGSARLGAALGVLSALALIGRFLPALLKTRKLMPAGIVVAVGLVVVAVGSCALFVGT